MQTGRRRGDSKDRVATPLTWSVAQDAKTAKCEQLWTGSRLGSLLVQVRHEGAKLCRQLKSRVCCMRQIRGSSCEGLDVLMVQAPPD